MSYGEEKYLLSKTGISRKWMSEDGKKRKSDTDFWSIPIVKKKKSWLQERERERKKNYIYNWNGTTN